MILRVYALNNAPSLAFDLECNLFSENIYNEKRSVNEKITNQYENCELDVGCCYILSVGKL